MAGTSTYVQLSNYALVEYVYSSETITTTQAKTFRIQNKYSDQYQFVNGSSAVNLTGNVLDRSASRLGTDASYWAYLDITNTTPVIQTDPNFVLSDVSAELLSNQKYDTVKVHLAAGYDFPGIDGIIIEIQWEEWTAQGTGGRRFTAGSQVFIKGEQTVSLNATPLFLGDRFYDRYVEFKVPALADTNFDFWNSPTSSQTIGYQYSFNNVGFSKTSQIYTNIYEIDSTSIVNSNSYFLTGDSFKSSFNAADRYSYVGCKIVENTKFNFIEYYPTFNGGFIADYLSNLNSAPGGEWVVINQINVYEQAGTNMLRTSSNTLLQEDGFDEPSIFRPVIRNAAYIYSFTVEYIMRLMNKIDNTEIIRKSTVTSASPKKYGFLLEQINVLDGFRPVKVYNKIVKIDSSAMLNSISDNQGAYGFGTPKIITNNLYVNNYFDVNLISADSTTNVSDSLGETVYPQGMNYIFITKYTNFVKFKLFTKSADKKQNVTFDFSASVSNTKLSFIFDDDSKIYFDAVQDITAANPAAGELLFRVDDATSAKLINGRNRKYYIVNKNNNGDESLIYSGNFDSFDNRAAVMERINSATVINIDAQISKLRKAQEDLTNPVTKTVATPTNSPASQSIATSQEKESAVVDKSTTFVTNSSKGIDNAIKNAAATDTKQTPSANSLNIPDVPGITPGMGSAISLALQPNVTNPSKPENNSELYKRINTGALNDITNNQSI